MNTNFKGTAPITGASSGIGALATSLAHDTGRSVEVIVADLNNKADLARVEEVLRTDTNITVLVNDLNVGAPLVRLTCAIVPAFLRRGSGAIINMASVVSIAPEVLGGVYGGTKAFVLAFSLSLHNEFADRKIRVQAVLPGATATEFWDIAGTPLEGIPSQAVMKADDLVDAAIAGFDQGEVVTIPSLPDIADWEAYEAARQNIMPKLSLSSPAARYGVTAGLGLRLQCL